MGYDNLTAIDWIFEYTKERQRIRHLYASNKGLFGYVRKVLDASHIWIILILTGIAVGVIAACIDVASSWLGDIKTGYCRTGGEGGKFYLNKSFCCWGYDGSFSSLPPDSYCMANLPSRFIRVSALDTVA